LRNLTVSKSSFKSFAGLFLRKPPFTGVLKDLKKKDNLKAGLVGLIQFRDTPKGTDKSVKSLLSVSQRRKQQPQYAPQGPAMFLGHMRMRPISKHYSDLRVTTCDQTSYCQRSKNGRVTPGRSAVISISYDVRGVFTVSQTM
jgi:hypothetical protein